MGIRCVPSYIQSVVHALTQANVLNLFGRRKTVVEKSENRWAEKKGSWLTYRPDIKVLDCTVRDGGLMNNSNFEDDFVKAVYQTCINAGIDYMEMGYKGAKRIYSPTEYGKWKHCSEEDVRQIVGDNPTDLKLSAMADVDAQTIMKTSCPRARASLICTGWRPTFTRYRLPST